MYVDTNSPEFRGLMTALVSLGLEFQSNEVGSAPEADDLLFFKWQGTGRQACQVRSWPWNCSFRARFPQLRVPQS